MFTLDQVVPWGRSFEEYRHMFALGEADLGGRILGCADGPASFNAEATRLGYRVVSCDPLYQWNVTQIRDRIRVTHEQILEQSRTNIHEFVWNTIPSVEALGQLRMKAMQTFLQDFDTGIRRCRYVAGGLPALPFADGSLDLAVCSHFLFLYTDHLTEVFHQEAVMELCRVALEARIFPLLALGGKPSRYVPGTVEYLRSRGYEVSIDNVPYEFQRGGNQMMRVRAGRSGYRPSRFALRRASP